MSADSGKQYGLILPKKGSTQDIIKRPSIFDEGSDSDNSSKAQGDWIKKAYQREAAKSVEKKQTKAQIDKALTQDPSIFQYDEVYDDIKDKACKSVPKKEERKQSRYIQSLKRNAERRKLENERRMERQVQKERQAEGEEFKDKETFVTSSYKKKLEEFQKMDEEEKRMDRLEEIGDVSKQKDISGFYRHLYKTTVDVESQNQKDENVKLKNDEKTTVSSKKSPAKEVNTEHFKQTDNDKKQKRQYRKRKKSASSKEEGEKTSSSSSSYSSSSSSSESDDEHKSEKKSKDKANVTEDKTTDKRKRSRSRGKENIENSLKIIDEGGEKKKKASLQIGTEKNHEKIESVTELTSTSLKEIKPSVNIWIKRTIGSNFDDALRRYLERKSKQQRSC